MDAPSILEILDARCGDMLKAYVLQEYYPDLKINLLMVRQPVGDAEAAFAKARAAEAAAPQDAATRAMADFKEAHHKKMFETIDPVAEARRAALPKVVVVDGKPQWEKPSASAAATLAPAPNTAPADAPLSEGEFEIEGKVFVSKARAAELRGCKEASVVIASNLGKWERRKSPKGGHEKVYLKSDALRKHGKVLAA